MTPLADMILAEWTAGRAAPAIAIGADAEVHVRPARHDIEIVVRDDLEPNHVARQSLPPERVRELRDVLTAILDAGDVLDARRAARAAE